MELRRFLHEKNEWWKSELLRDLIQNTLAWFRLPPKFYFEFACIDTEALGKLSSSKGTGSQNVSKNVGIVGHESSLAGGD